MGGPRRAALQIKRAAQRTAPKRFKALERRSVLAARREAEAKKTEAEEAEKARLAHFRDADRDVVQAEAVVLVVVDIREGDGRGRHRLRKEGGDVGEAAVRLLLELDGRAVEGAVFEEDLEGRAPVGGVLQEEADGVEVKAHVAEIERHGDEIEALEELRAVDALTARDVARSDGELEALPARGDGGKIADCGVETGEERRFGRDGVGLIDADRDVGGRRTAKATSGAVLLARTTNIYIATGRFSLLPPSGQLSVTQSMIRHQQMRLYNARMEQARSRAKMSPTQIMNVLRYGDGSAQLGGSTPLGMTYRISGNYTRTGQPYIGSTLNLASRMANRRDKRGRGTVPEILDHAVPVSYLRYEEEYRIRQYGGVQSLDNMISAMNSAQYNSFVQSLGGGTSVRQLILD